MQSQTGLPQSPPHSIPRLAVRVLVFLCALVALFVVLVQVGFTYNEEGRPRPAPYSQSGPMEQEELQIKYKTILQKLRLSGSRREPTDLELHLTTSFWGLRTWLQEQAKTKECKLLHKEPPSFFNFTQYNLWTGGLVNGSLASIAESRVRMLAQLVWRLQWLVESVVEKVQANFISKVTKEKRIYIGKLNLWDIGNFKPEWLKTKRISGCNLELLGPCKNHLDPVCTITKKESDYRDGNVDAVASYANSNPFSVALPRSNRSAPWFKYVLESPYILPVHIKNEYVSTYHAGVSLIPHKPWQWLYYDPRLRSKPVKVDYHSGKTKLAAIFVSNCNSSNNRLGYVRALQKHMEVDVYGKCGDKSCSRDKAECFQMLRRDYYFYLAFENANCEEYVTEKFFVNGIGNGLIPVVLGAPPAYYIQYAPQNSYIHVEDFDTPQQLAGFLEYVAGNSEIYNSYFEWIGTGEVVYHSYWFCDLCHLLYYEEPMPVAKKHQWLPGTKMRNGQPLCLERARWFWTRYV